MTYKYPSKHMICKNDILVTYCKSVMVGNWRVFLTMTGLCCVFQNCFLKAENGKKSLSI